MACVVHDVLYVRSVSAVETTLSTVKGAINASIMAQLSGLSKEVVKN